MGDGFDVHAVRHRMKLVRETREGALYQNRDAVPCPHCGDPFDELFLTDRPAHRFSPDEAISFCVVREPARFIVCTHRTDG